MSTVAQHKDLFSAAYHKAAQYLDVEKANVVECEFSDIRDIFAAHHYKGARIGGGITPVPCYGLREPRRRRYGLEVPHDIPRSIRRL